MKVLDFKCPDCGAPVQFLDKNEVIQCKFCGNSLCFQQEVDIIQEENASGIKEYTDRLYDLIRQEKFVQVTKDAQDALLTYPYSGRLHLCLLLAELELKKPSLLATVGNDYSSSINYQNCMRYMTSEDKEDLTYLFTKNARLGNVPKVKKEIKVDPKGESVVDAQLTTLINQVVQEENIPQQVTQEQIPGSINAENTTPHNNVNNINREIETPKKASAIKGYLFVIIPLAICFIFFIVSLSLAASQIAFGNTLLIISGVIEIILGIILFVILDKTIKFNCPVCGAKRVHSREFIRQEWVKENSKNIQVNTYMDYFTCPECGETLSEQVKKKNENGIHEF